MLSPSTIVYIGLILSTWVFLQLITSNDSQAIFPKQMARFIPLIYLVIGMGISTFVMTMPILVTGTISVTAIMLTMFLRRFQRSATLNITMLTDVSFNKAISNAPALFKVRDKQFHRARQSYGLITIVNNSAYALAAVTAFGMMLMFFIRLLVVH